MHMDFQVDLQMSNKSSSRIQQKLDNNLHIINGNDSDNKNNIRYFHSYAEIGKLAYPELAFSMFQKKFNLVEGTVNVGIVLTSLGVSSA